MAEQTGPGTPGANSLERIGAGPLNTNVPPTADETKQAPVDEEATQRQPLQPPVKQSRPSVNAWQPNKSQA